jgi:CubicO group peptidase (beta-lactamase class C family)
MRTMTSVLLLAILAGAPTAAAPPPIPAASFQDPNRRAKIAAVFPRLEALVAQQAAAQNIPGLAFGVVVDGDLAYAKGFGVADLGTRAPVDADTVFRIGSITKTFTSLAILRLRDAGKLSLDDPAARYLPELGALRYPTRDAPPITIRHLLTHTSGLPRLGNFSYAQSDHDVTEREVLAGLDRVTLQTPPGTAFSYSNFGVGLLGPLVRRVTGMRYRDYVSTQILAPLGMRSTVWAEGDVPAGRLASGYAPGPGGLTKVAHWRLGDSEAAGGLYSSLRDMSRYAAFQLAAYPPRDDPEAGPLRRSSVREAHAAARGIGLQVQPHEPSAEHPYLVAAKASGVGLAWHSYQDCEIEEVVWHNGGTEGYAAVIHLLPLRGVALIVLANSRDADLGAVTMKASDILLESKGMAPRALAPSPALARLMAGLADLYRRFDEKKYRALASPAFLDAIPVAEIAREADHLRKVHGACADPQPVEVHTPWGARYEATCERGRIEYDDVHADADGKLLGASVTSRDLPPSPAMAGAAARIAGLIGGWSDATYEQVLAPTFPRPAMQDFFRGVRAQYKSCKVGKAMAGDGERRATLALACAAGGDLALSLALDDKGARAVGMRIVPLASSALSPAEGRCPAR